MRKKKNIRILRILLSQKNKKNKRIQNERSVHFANYNETRATITLLSTEIKRI